MNQSNIIESAPTIVLLFRPSFKYWTFGYQTFTCPLFEWFCYSDVPYSDPHCTSKHVKSGVLVSFGFHWMSNFVHHSILGHYINLDLKKLKTAGTFCNKIWQANRFYVQAAERLRTDSIKLAEFDQFLNKSTSQQLEQLSESSR